MNAPKFTAELKAKWIDALRSGKYQQCDKQLHDGKAYCCMGVLAKLCGAADAQLLNEYTCSPVGYRPIDMPDASYLAEMNDDGESFRAIADYIEANIPAQE